MLRPQACEIFDNGMKAAHSQTTLFFPRASVPVVAVTSSSDQLGRGCKKGVEEEWRNGGAEGRSPRSS